MILMYGMNLRV